MNPPGNPVVNNYLNGVPIVKYIIRYHPNSARNAANAEREREQRVRERERNREQLLNNINNLIGRGRRDQPAVGVVVVAGAIPANNNNNNVQGVVEMAGREEHRGLNRAADNANASRNNNNASYSNSLTGSNKRKCISYGPESVESWAATEMEQETFAFLWSLKGFSAFSGTDEVKSPQFRGGPKSAHFWQLKMSPKKKSDDVDYFAVHLILTGFGDGDNSNVRKLKVRFQISLLDTDGRPGKQAGSATMNVCEFKKCSVWGYDKFITTTDLTAPNRRLIDEDTLKIHCRVWIEGEVKHKTGNGGAACSSLMEDDRLARQKDRLSKELGNLWQSMEFADVALTTNSRTFMAHKAVLGARSKVFAAMFQSKMVEASKNTVEITEFDEDIVEAMLEYMYSAKVESLNDKAPDLLQIAEKYDLIGLKEECEYAIAENLTVENSAEVLLMAHLYNANLLKPKVIDFINRNKEDVKKTKAFQKVAQSNAAVFVELYLSQ